MAISMEFFILFLAASGMYIQSLYGYSGFGSVEILEFYFSQSSTINGISKVSIELLHIKLVRTTADFLIGSEGNAHGTVLDFRMLISGYSMAVIISAMPALSSAPSKVVPSVQ